MGRLDEAANRPPVVPTSRVFATHMAPAFAGLSHWDRLEGGLSNGAMALPPELVSYFREAIGGASETAWHVWWRENAKRAQEQLSRLDYLELKFRRLKGADMLLRREGLDVPWSTHAKRLARWALLADSAVDDRGSPRRDQLDAAYGLLFGRIAANDTGGALRSCAGF